MSKKSELAKLAERSAKGHKTILGLPGQSKVSPERVAEILGEENVGGAAASVESVATTPRETSVPPTPPASKYDAAKYVLAKRYSPKTDRNIKTWGRIVSALEEGPKTYAELTECVKDHKDFVGYMVRNGHLALEVIT